MNKKTLRTAIIAVIIANVIVLFLLVNEILKIRDSAFERVYHLETFLIQAKDVGARY